MKEASEGLRTHPSRLWKSYAIAQIICAFISFLASVLIVTSASRAFFSSLKKGKSLKESLKKTTSPYQRIIFCISFSDILFSLAFITGPFLVTKSDPIAHWALSDSSAGCVLNGTFFSFGASTSILYYATLCFFYYCKVSKRMSDELFTRRFETKIHVMILFIALSGACSSIATGIYNTYPSGTFCAAANTPTGCNQQPEIYGEECDARIATYVKYFALVSFSVSATSMLIIFFSMAGLVHAVLTKDRRYGDQPNDPSEEQLQQYKLRKRLLRETMIQAIMYAAGWFVCQIPAIIASILFQRGIPLDNMPGWFRIFTAMSYPLSSAFNVLIFTRPALRQIQRVDTSVSWLRAFRMVIQSGGHVPNEFQHQRSKQQQQQQQQNVKSMSSRAAYGASSKPYQYQQEVCDPGQSFDSLNVEMLGSLGDLSEGNPAYRSEDKWSHNLGGFSDLNMIHEESDDVDSGVKISQVFQ
ncbi:predicted protein [Chaetoceros tenuissimus]|uniref:G-protein coupled receptors family 1 profile domain-containing protein n=1 Tax=Chaetoceros tenuissimus TaxID=426638 RepID=A0AAD3DC94_9STRA|nr:predicted protein [Chaetoceros tenuissimus]